MFSDHKVLSEQLRYMVYVSTRVCGTLLAMKACDNCNYWQAYHARSRLSAYGHTAWIEQEATF